MITASGQGRFWRRRVRAAPWGLVGAIAPQPACYRHVPAERAAALAVIAAGALSGGSGGTNCATGGAPTEHVRAWGVRMAIPAA